MSPPEQRARETGPLVDQSPSRPRTTVPVAGEQKHVQQLQPEPAHRLGELDAAKTEFVARVSHELRSPLTSLLGYLELLQDGTVGALSREQRRMLEAMERNTHRLQSLVEDLLTTEHIDAGAFRLHRTRVPLSDIVDHLVQLLAPDIHGHALRCTVTLEPGIELDADPDQLERMLANLVSNAIKFTPPDGHIDLAARADAGHAVITVRDTGIGVPLEEQPQLFTRFFRSTASETLEIQGAGLGLFIVNQIVEAHGGAIAVASTPGEGTAVTIRLPLRRV